MAPGPASQRRILVICLDSGKDGEKIRSLQSWIAQTSAQGAAITVLCASGTCSAFRGLNVAIWPDGATNGALKLLSIVRRIAWAAFTDVYDLDVSRRTRAFRWFVRPCPPWHRGLDLKP